MTAERHKPAASRERRALLRTGCVLAVTAQFAIAIGGCAGIPAKSRPVDVPNAFPLSDVEPAGGSWPAEQWWQRYRDQTLDRLIDMALAASPTLAAAHARFDTARQSVRLAGAAAGAHVDLVGDANRQRLSDNGLIPPHLLGFTWYDQADLGLQASYAFDWWGRQRASVEAAIDEAHAAQAERSASALILASSIADTYFGWQADQARLALARERLAVVLRERAIAEARIHAELDAADTLHRNDAAVAAVRERIAALDGSAKLRVVALAAFVGRPAAELPPLAARSLPSVGGGLPDDVRLDLLSRRADIVASRWRVEAAERNLDSARAEFFPDVSISALAGVSSVDLGKLLEYGSRVPQVTAAIHLPLFDSGRLKARYGANQAAIASAVAGYDETLVEAARDVAAQVASRAQIDAQRTERVIEVDAARRLRAAESARVRQGITDTRAELAATESWIEQRDGLAQLDSAALSADIGLQRALGGGYGRDRRVADAAPPATPAAP